jgi:hypothetical protein
MPLNIFWEGAASKMTLEPGNLPFRCFLEPPWKEGPKPDIIITNPAFEPLSITSDRGFFVQ